MDLSGLDIKSKKPSAFAPTPNNTPLNAAPISGSMKPTLQTMSEDQVLNVDDGDSKFGLPNEQLIQLIQGRLGSLMGRQSGYIQSLPESVQVRINGLKGLQIKQSELEAQFNNEIFELEKKYLGLYKPLFDERSKIIEGQKEPSEEDIESGKLLREEEEADEDLNNDIPVLNGEFKGIPEFWLTALKNHPVVADIISDEDEEALKSLVDISYRFLEEEQGFALDFTFSENEFFTNSILTKKYFYTQSEDYGEHLLDHSEGTEIEWKSGKDLTVEVQQKKQVHKVTQETRIVTNETPKESFFGFFAPIPVIEEELDDEEERSYNQAVEGDYELGEELKDRIIPHAVDWFTGKALAMGPHQHDGFCCGGDEFEDEEEEDEEENEA